MMEAKAHWDAIYTQRQPGQVSWYQPHLAVSLKLLANAGLSAGSRVIDVGGGASTLVDDLLARGIRGVTVLDISSRALAATTARIGDEAKCVTWIAADITHAQLPSASYDLWHDRAVFHFLTNTEDRRRYATIMREALKLDGQAVLATFSLQGPPRCSGLEVVRYSPDTLQAELGSSFRLLEAVEEDHKTPSGAVQKKAAAQFRKL